MREGPREAGRFGARVARRHRPMSTTIDALIAADIVIRHVEARRPAGAQIAAGSSLAVQPERPMFLPVAADRSS